MPSVTALLLTAASLAIGVTSLLVAWRQLRAVDEVALDDVEPLAIALKRTPRDARLSALVARSAPGTFAHRLGSEALGAPNDRARVAFVNELLADVDHALSSRSAWPKAAVRIAVLSGLLLASIAILANVDMSWAIAVASVCAAAGIGCAAAERAVVKRVEDRKRAVDVLVSVVLEPNASIVPNRGDA